ncbi:MAG: hypothetical protein GKR90_14370 [Pseudomonadales bacterium]|nr:hypothetical protein [Pseudomonadales bacterium]
MAVTLIASEGGSGSYPENTAYAVKRSLAEGVDGCELDFHLTADNVFVAHHDYTLNAALTRDADGAWLGDPGPTIKHSTLQELREFNVGAVNPNSKTARRYPDRASLVHETVPTFEDIEQAFESSPGAELWFEAKTDPFDVENTTMAEVYVDALTQVLGASSLFSRTVLIAFDWRLLELAAIAMPGIQTGYLTVDFNWLSRSPLDEAQLTKLQRWYGNFGPRQFGDSTPRAIAAARGTNWSPYCQDLSTDLVKEAHDLGLNVSTWGADTEAEIEQALGHDVDSLTTGYVARARRLSG